MDVVNDTPFQEALALGLGPDRQPCVAVVVKATFTLPAGEDGAATVAQEQLPIATADEYYEGDTTGSVRTESDDVPYKPRADIVLAGTAYAPRGRATTKVDVALRVGPTRKVVRVFGDRKWLFPSRMVMVPVMSDPEPFEKMPLVYERAFGGFDRKAGSFYSQNHIGRGYFGKKKKESVNEALLPNLEDPSDPITSWDDEPMPAGFGCLSRSWQPRAGYAGTEEGMAQPHALFGVAADFRPDYHNGAHPDLQVPGYLRGDEEVELMHLTPDGYRTFRLPGVRPVVRLGLYDDVPDLEADLPMPEIQQKQLDVVLDTLVFLPDDGVFYQVWRGRHPVDELDTEEDLERALLRLARLEIGSEEV